MPLRKLARSWPHDAAKLRHASLAGGPIILRKGWPHHPAKLPRKWPHDAANRHRSLARALISCGRDPFARCLGASATCLTERLPSSLSSRPLVSSQGGSWSVRRSSRSSAGGKAAGRGAQHNKRPVGLLKFHDVSSLVRKVLSICKDALAPLPTPVAKGPFLAAVVQFQVCVCGGVFCAADSGSSSKFRES